MKKSTYWLNQKIGGRCSPKHFDFTNDELLGASIICLEEDVPQQDRFLKEVGKRVLHLPFPKVQPATVEADKNLTSTIVIKGLSLINKAFKEFKSEKVIVHCGHGNDRTGIVLLGYLIFNQHMSFEAAYSFLKHCNNEALTYPGFDELAQQLFNI